MLFTYLAEVPHFLTLNILCVYVFCLLVVIHCMAALLYCKFERGTTFGLLFITSDPAHCTSLEAANHATNEATQKLFCSLALCRLAGTRGLRALVIPTERACVIGAVLETQPMKHMAAKDRDG